ncbi:MAG: WD40 repeat domain-containing protein, partial [Phycisphaerae bacterium]
LYTAMLDDLTDLDWEVAVTLDDRWEMLRFAPTGTLAVAKRTGEVAVYERKALIGNWRTSLSGLQDFWFDSDRRALLTLRGDGGVTAWGTSSASEQRRGLSSKPIAQWALATNGSTAVFSDPAGVTRIYRPDVSPDPYRILEGKVFSFQLGATPNVTMGVSHDGRRAAVNKGSTLRLIEMSDAPRPPSVRTYQHINSQFEHLALNRDGSMIAIHAPSADGELQWLTFHRWGAGSAGETRETRPDLAELSLIANPISFVGASIKHLAFLPGTSKLLVARSNGEIIIIDPAVLPPRDVSLQADETPAAPPPWLVLDSPAVWLAFSRDADSLAVVSEDGILRVISMETGQLQQRIRVGEDVTSISFDSAGDSLLLRESTGVISIIDIASSEKVATLNVAADRAANAAFWMGEKDRLIVSDGRVLELRYQNVDDAIARNRMSAIERKAILHLRLDDFDRATALLAGLDAEKYPSVEKLRSDIFAAALQRPGYSMPPAWLAIVREATARPIRLRFGHVAYEGNQFQLAGTLLRELVSSQLEQFGSITIRRLAECEYLLERYAEATALFKEVVTRGQFAPSIISTVQLEQAAAALLSGDPDSAKKIVLKIGSAEPENMRSLGTQSAVTVGSYLVGLQTETFLTAGIKQLMKTFAEDSLSYHDDAHFFLGELARVGGNRVEAASRYQRCIDLSRDVWPANWARYRLLQMAQQFQKS